MFIIETTILILGVLTLSAWSFFREYRKGRRDRREAQRLKEMLARLEGGTLTDAQTEFGFPNEVVEGASGRKLYVWKIFEEDQVLILTATAESTGRIVATALRRG
jgi:putative component of toxin-antitoxin plasmid stabilization module